MIDNLTGSTHKLLRLKTAKAHESLHVNPLIRKLLRPDLTSLALERILAIYYHVYHRVEKNRVELGVWPSLHLNQQVNQLRQDLALLESNYDLTADFDLSWTNCRISSLGSLYVLHGAAFGGLVIAKSVAKSLPNVALQFFAGSLNLRLWHYLIKEIESVGEASRNFQRLSQSANKTFSLLNSMANQEYSGLLQRQSIDKGTNGKDANFNSQDKYLAD